MADDADTHEKDVEEIDERMQKLTHKLENARRGLWSSWAGADHSHRAQASWQVRRVSVSA